MKLFIFITVLFVSTICYSQKGSLTVSFTPAVATGKTITADLSGLIKNTYAITDYTAYWFINPHTNLHHVVIELNNKQGGSASFLSTAIEFNSTENNFEFWDHPHPNSDSNFFAVNKALYVISAPLEYDEPAYGGTNNHNGPLKIHITTFTSSELEFDITGTAEYGTKEGDGKFLGYGTIQAHGHFYRQGGYEKSAQYPNCNCDPTIYATTYDVDEGDKRTASACEAVMLYNIFNAAKKAMAPIHAQAFNGSGKAPEGALMLRKLDHYDMSPEVPEAPTWPFDYNYKKLVSRGLLDAQKRYYNTDDYGIELDEMPGQSAMDGLNAESDATKQALVQQMQSMGLKEKQAKIDSLSKLMQDKKMTLQEYSDKVRAIMEPAMKQQDKFIAQQPKSKNDFGRMNMESMMLIKFIINPREAFTYMKLNSSIAKTDVQLLHTVAGAAYVIKAPAVKDGDGNWEKNKCYVLMGKYQPPVIGNHDSYTPYAVNITPVYPANGNKLLVYNVVVEMEGGADQINKALDMIDFAALQQLISVQ